jgi:hypothetical protein
LGLVSGVRALFSNPSNLNGGPATDRLTKNETLLNANEMKMTNTRKRMEEVLPIEVPRIFAIFIF